MIPVANQLERRSARLFKVVEGEEEEVEDGSAAAELNEGMQCQMLGVVVICSFV